MADAKPEVHLLLQLERTAAYVHVLTGTVVISSIDYGLFVVRPDYEAMFTGALACDLSDALLALLQS